jgi:methyl-accepting chemotaxis protein
MKMTLRKKLFGGFFAVLIILAVIVGLSSYEITSVDRTYTELINDKAKKLVMIQQLELAVKQQQSSLRGFLITGDDTSLQNFSKAHDSYLQTSQKLHETIRTPKAAELLKQLDSLEGEFNQFALEVMELKKQNRTEEYTEQIATVGRDIAKRFEGKAEELGVFQEELLNKGIMETSAKVESIKTLVLILGIVSVLVGVGISLFISRLISNPVLELAKAAERISSGDLTADEIKIKNRDEIGDLASSFNQMSRNLRELIKQVGINAEQVAASAEELTASAEQTSKATEQITLIMQDVASGVEKQVKSVEDTTQMATEMAAGVQQIATNASHVSATAVHASETALEGNRSIQSAVQQMNSINRSVQDLANVVKGLGERSKEIGHIIEVITGIAEQTNLLALNAAIEAARAGEHGRGFAVVADEVRKLAEQSAQSAQQISEMISAIQEETTIAVQTMEETAKEVVEGIGSVHAAGDSFSQIQSAVQEVSAQIEEVSSSVQQMAAGVEQIVHAMKMISDVAEAAASSTQEGSAATEEQLASMEEIASSASSLSKMAEELHAHIGKFKV